MIELQLVIEEVFVGDKTGSTNITRLRRWLDLSGRKVDLNYFQMWNAKNMLENHEWDDTFKERIESLVQLLEKNGKFEPLILVKGKVCGYFVIDGWHRLKIIYEIYKKKEMTICPFPCYVVTQKEVRKFRHHG